MAAEKLGLGRCPVCGGVHARVSLMKTGLVVMTCTDKDCGMQLFARGEGADEKMRDRIIKAPAAIEPKPATPAPAAKPARAPVANPFDFLLNPGRAAA